MRSTDPISAASAGTKLPMCASSTINAVCRMKVDLPPMLGPVMIIILCCGLSSASLATNGSLSMFSTTGCRPPVIFTMAFSFKIGRQRESVSDRSARQAITSSSEMAVAVSCNLGSCSPRTSSNCSYNSFSRASARLLLLRALSSNSLSSGVIKRSAFFSVWRRT